MADDERGDPAKETENVNSRSAHRFDVSRLLRAAEILEEYGVDAGALLAEAVRAEMFVETRPWDLASLVEGNDPSRMVDVFESPSFRRRLRELRVWARIAGMVPGTNESPPEGATPGVKRFVVKIDELLGALRELKAIGRALATVGSNPPARRKRRFEEMVLLQSEDGSAVLDAQDLPVIITQAEALKRGGGRWQPMDAVERNLKAFTGLIQESMRRTKGLRKRPEIRAALESEATLVPPPFRDTIADILTKQKQQFPRMRAESVALCWAYRVEVDPSIAEALRRRRADRQKKHRRRGGHSSKRNVP